MNTLSYKQVNELDSIKVDRKPFLDALESTRAVLKTEKGTEELIEHLQEVSEHLKEVEKACTNPDDNGTVEYKLEYSAWVSLALSFLYYLSLERDLGEDKKEVLTDTKTYLLDEYYEYLEKQDKVNQTSYELFYDDFNKAQEIAQDFSKFTTNEVSLTRNGVNCWKLTIN